MKTHKDFLFIITAVIVLVGTGCDMNDAATTGNEERPDTSDITDLMLPEGLATATPMQLTKLRAVMKKGTTIRNIEIPSQWPQLRRWSPRRHFGPLYGNSPDIKLNMESATFVYNDFFTGHPDAAVFRKYYGPTLPSNTPTPAAAIPGTLPAGGFGDLSLGFDRLTYSSRYGGSLKLMFRSLEDFQVEYREANTVWDIASLEMAVYVRPVTTYFNPNAPLSSVFANSVHVEFHPQGVIGYTVSANGGLTADQADPMPALLVALGDTARTMSTATTAMLFRRDATRFSHGLVHIAFWEEIGQTNNVTGIEISDNFFFPRTSRGHAIANVSVQVSDISLDTEPGDEEIYITLEAAHMFQGVSIPPTFSWEFPEIGNHGSTSERIVGVFPLDWDCGELQTVALMLSVREKDDISFDDNFVTDPLAFHSGALNCSGMQTAFNNGQFGLFVELPEKHFAIVKRNDFAGVLTARVRISVFKQ